MCKHWKNLPDRDMKARRMGYADFETAIILLYDKYQSSRKVGEHFEMTGAGIRYALKKLGVKLRKKGGPNNPKGLGGYTHKTQ